MATYININKTEAVTTLYMIQVRYTETDTFGKIKSTQDHETGKCTRDFTIERMQRVEFEPKKSWRLRNERAFAHR